MKLCVSVIALCLLLPAAPARAGWLFGGGFEHFSWVEDTAPLELKENGALFVFVAGYSWPLGEKFSAEYRGRYYVGDVEYNGFLLYDPTVPVTSTTNYTGTTQQGKLRHPVTPTIDVSMGLDLDWWQRSLSTNQHEDYRIVSMRIGAEHPVSPSVPWQLGGGIKFTLSTHENAHFDELGFDQNPALEPGQSVTPYLDVGYAFSPHWSIVGSYDGFSFGTSNDVPLSNASISGVFYQPASDMRVFGLRLEYR